MHRHLHLHLHRHLHRRRGRRVGLMQMMLRGKRKWESRSLERSWRGQVHRRREDVFEGGRGKVRGGLRDVSVDAQPVSRGSQRRARGGGGGATSDVEVEMISIGKSPFLRRRRVEGRGGRGRGGVEVFRHRKRRRIRPGVAWNAVFVRLRVFARRVFDQAAVWRE